MSVEGNPPQAVQVTFEPSQVSQQTIEQTMADEGYPVAR